MTTKLDINSMIRVLVAVPVYNCQHQISRTLALIPMAGFKVDEVLVIDNQSQDQTLRVATASLKKLKGQRASLIQNHENVGLGGSHQVAFDYGWQHGFTHLIILHGDDQARLKDFQPVMADLDLNQDVVLGARFMAGSELVGYDQIRRWGNLGLNLVFSLATGRQIFDTGSGLNLYRLAAFKPAEINCLPRDLTFNSYLLLWSLFKRHHLKFAPISWRETDQVSNAKVWRQGWRILRLLGQYWLDSAGFFRKLRTHNRPASKFKFIFNHG